jgi:hypothetical protein
MYENKHMQFNNKNKTKCSPNTRMILIMPQYHCMPMHEGSINFDMHSCPYS